MATNAELTEWYRSVRDRCLSIGRGLSDEQAATIAPCTPAWTVKDVFAHLVGVPVDVLEGNTEHAATAPWADAQVARRSGDSLTQILDEWEATADQIDGLLLSVALDIDPRFFLDCWTHEWDIRHALGIAAVPDLSLPTYVLPMVGSTLSDRDSATSEAPVVIHVETPHGIVDVAIGDGDPAIEATTSLFELMRVIVGRRSATQIATLGAGMTPARLVYFEANSVDISDPVLAE